MDQKTDMENRDMGNRVTQNRDWNRECGNVESRNPDRTNRAGAFTGQCRDRKRKRVIAVLATGALLCAAAVTFLLYDYRRAELESDRALASLRELEGKEIAGEGDGAPDGIPQAGTGETADAGTSGEGSVNPYGEIFQEYPDIKGWLRVEGTGIDYPVLQREGDDEYYLYLDYKGDEDKRGSLILDEGSSVEEGEFTTNLLIHGHNMKDGSMFGGLDGYRSGEYCREHARMTLYTRDGRHDYEVIAAFDSQVYYASDLVFKYYNFFQADTEEEFHYFYDNIRELSLYDTGVAAEYGDRFLTLSTCAYHVEDGRFVVVAKETAQAELLP